MHIFFNIQERKEKPLEVCEWNGEIDLGKFSLAAVCKLDLVGGVLDQRQKFRPEVREVNGSGSGQGE